MAKKRFPSDANKSKAAEQADGSKEVQGSKVELVKVQYKKDNHHVLSGVHALRQGDNHLPKSVWEEAKSHPSVASMIASGHIVGPADEEESEEEAIEEQAEAADAQEASEAAAE